MAEDFSEFGGSGGGEDFSEFSSVPATKKLGGSVNGLPEVKEAPHPGPLPDQRVIDAALYERSPEAKRYQETLSKWEDLKRAQDYGLDTLTGHAASGTIGKGLGMNPQFRRNVDQFRDEHPIGAFFTDTAAVAPLALAAPATAPAAALTGAGLAALGTRAESGQDLINDVSGGAVLGLAGHEFAPVVNKVVNAVAHPIQTIKSALGYGLQVPQKITDAVAEPVGKAAQKLGVDAVDDVQGLPSAAVKALRKKAGPFERAIVENTDEALRAAPDEQAAARVAARDARMAEKLAEKRTMSQAIDAEKQAALEKIAKDREELIRMSSADMEKTNPGRKIPGKDVAAPVAPARDVKPRAPLTPEVRNEEALVHPMGEHRVAPLARGADADRPEWYNRAYKPGFADPAVAAESMADDAIGAQAMSRYRQAASENSEINGLPWVNQYAKTAEFQGGMPMTPETQIAGTKVAGMGGPGSAMQRALQKFQQSLAGRSEFAERIAATNDEIAARGVPRAQTAEEIFDQLAPGVRQSGVDAQNSAMQAQQQAAQSRLRNIATGRKVMAPVMGAVGGNATLGVPGAVLGAVTGTKGSTLLDVVGAVGQKLSESARKDAGKPSRIAQLANDPGPIGEVVRRVLQSATDDKGAAARAYMLMMQPAFRQAIADQQKSEDSAR